MDNKVIEVLDYMGEKLGIAVDWTAENVWPQVTEFMMRYQKYAIIKHAIWIVISLIVVFACSSWMKKTYTNIINKNEKSFWYKVWDEIDGEFPVLITYTIAVGCVLGFFVVAICDIFQIVEWITIPEIQFFETFTNYLNSAG